MRVTTTRASSPVNLPHTMGAPAGNAPAQQRTVKATPAAAPDATLRSPDHAELSLPGEKLLQEKRRSLLAVAAPRRSTIAAGGPAFTMA